MKKKKVIVPNIVAGGTAVPLGSNYYLMRGRKHEEGGIDVGANPRTGLEVEDGEVMQLKNKEVRVFSTVPFLNGQSPAQKVMGGENPNKVFAQQEAYKDRNNINDDGTRKAKFGLEQNGNYVAQSDNTRVDRTNIQYYEQPDKRWVQQGDFLVNTETGERIQNALPLERVYPEFDLLSLGISLSNLPKGFTKSLNTNDKSLYYRQLDKGSKGLERAKNVGVIDTKSSGGINFTTSKGTTLRLGKTFDTPFFNKGGFWYNNVKDMDVIVGKDSPLLDWKMITQHGRVTGDAARAAGRRTPFYNGSTNQAPTELFELYRHYPIIGYRNVTNGFPFLPVTGLNTISNVMDKKGYGGNHLLNTKYKQKQVIDMKDNNSRTKAKAGLRYILQTNGNSRLGYVPPTGESLSEAKGRTKAELGIEKKDYKSLVRNMTDKELRNEYININKNVGPSNADADIRNKNRIISDEQHRRKKYNIPNFGFTEMVGLPQPPKENTKLSIPNIGINNNILTDSIVEPVDSFSLTNHIKDTINVQKPVNKIAVKPNNIGTKNKEEGNYGFPTVTFGTGYVPTISGVNPSGGKLTDWWYPIKKNVTNTQTTPLNVNMPVSKVNRTLPNFNLTEIASYPKASNINIPTEIPNIGVNTDTIIMPMTRINTPMFNTSNSSSSTPEIKPINIKQDTQSFWDKTKNWINENPNTASEIASSAANIIGAITSYNTNKRMLNDLNYNRKPIPRIAAKLKTNININPQLDKMRESLANYERNIQSGTASSQVALARKQKARANSLSGYNELYGYKENAETELINKDRLNQQEVANQSIADYNSYIEKKMAFGNAVREKKAENVVSLVNNLASIPSDIISRTDKRRSDALNAALIMARNPNVTPEYLESLGIKLPGNKRKNNKKD